MEGFIQIHRKMLEWERYDDINTKVLFIHLLIKANWKDKKWRGIDIKRGEILTGRIILSEETGLTQQQIRTSLDKLKTTNEITIKPTNKYSIIKLTNYDDYQQSNQQTTEQVTNNQPTSNQQVTTTNKVNKENKNNNIISKDITTEVESFGNEEINNMQSIIKKTIEDNGMIYKAGRYERARIKNILEGKDFGKVCEKCNMDRKEFVINIINLASKLQYSKPINNGADLYSNYADVYNKALKTKKNILQPKKGAGITTIS